MWFYKNVPHIKKQNKVLRKFIMRVCDYIAQTLVNHGYTDAAQCLETEYAENWQTFNFPEI
jgi:hypothetical protein